MEFEFVFILQGVEGILESKRVFFRYLKMAEMLDFTGFYRSRYRTIFKLMCEWNRWGRMSKTEQ